MSRLNAAAQIRMIQDSPKGWPDDVAISRNKGAPATACQSMSEARPANARFRPVDS